MSKKSTKIGQRQLAARLQALGFSGNESAVYLAALTLGPSSVADLALHSGIKRPSVYPVVESLEAKGAMRIELKGFKRRFVAASPDALRSIFARNFSEFEGALAELSALRRTGESQDVVRLYRGVEAVKTLYDELLSEVRPGDDYLVMTDFDRWLALDKQFFSGFLRRRSRILLRLRLILARGAKSSLLSKAGPNRALVRELPSGASIDVNLVITPNRLVFHQLARPFSAVAIDNSHMVSMQRQIFNLMWESLPDFD